MKENCPQLNSLIFCTVLMVSWGVQATPDTGPGIGLEGSRNQK